MKTATVLKLAVVVMMGSCESLGPNCTPLFGTSDSSVTSGETDTTGTSNVSETSAVSTAASEETTLTPDATTDHPGVGSSTGVVDDTTTSADPTGAADTQGETTTTVADTMENEGSNTDEDLMNTTVDSGETSGGSSESTGDSDETTGATVESSTGGSTTGEAPGCTDGIVENQEQCDDGNDNDNDACSNMCKSQRVVFVTFDPHPPTLEPFGLDYADEMCQIDAITAGLPGTFRAWIGAGSNTPSDRFDVTFAGKYFSTGGDLIAANGFAGLVDGSILNAIDTDADGATVGNKTVWTGLLENGNSSGFDCMNWSSGSDTATIGSTLLSNKSWTNNTTASCGQNRHFYCIQDL